MHLLGCPVNNELLACWSGYLVSPSAPFYVDDASRALVPPGNVLFTRGELGGDYSDLPLEARDSYAIYHVDRGATWVALLDDHALDDMAPGARRALLRAQWRFGRGQVYDRHVVRELCAGFAPAVTRLDAWAVDTPDGDKVALQHRVWWSLPDEVRRRWLRWFVARDRADCLSTSLRADTWAAMDARHRDVVRYLAGTFTSPSRSGPNCFSTTLAAVTVGVEQAKAVSRLWLPQPPFVRALDARGFHRVERPGHVEDIPPGTVLVWYDGAEMAQHACFVPATDLALNKDAQGWFAPRQLVALTHVVREWEAEDLTLTLYQRD